MNIGFVIGNGISRKNQPVDRLHKFGTVYSCNWAGVDVPSHHVVIPDKQTLFQILSERITAGLTVWTRHRWRGLYQHQTPVFHLPEKLYPESVDYDRERYWDSGTHACWLAAKKHDIVVMLGFDLWNNGVNNNIYAGQYRYSHDPVDPSIWIYQLKQTFLKHPSTSFVQIQNTDWQLPESWKNIDNVSIDDYSSLTAMFG